MPLFESLENTTSQPTNPPPPTDHSPDPSPENTGQSDDSESEPYNHALVSLAVSSTTANLATPLTPPMDAHSTNTPPGVYDSSPSAPSHRPPSSNHAAPAGPRLGPEAFGTPHGRC